MGMITKILVRKLSYAYINAHHCKEQLKTLFSMCLIYCPACTENSIWLHV